MDSDFINQQLNKLMNRKNNQPHRHFEGYSPYEMHLILYEAFRPDSPIELKKMTETEYEKIPLFNIIRTLMTRIDEGEGLQLTKAGYLPTKIVGELHEMDFMNTNSKFGGKYKPQKETDTGLIHLSRILLEMSGLVKKRHGTLSLTKSSNKLLQNNEDLLKEIFITFTTKFHWAYRDYFGDNNVGQLGSGFSLILVSKYGGTRRLDSFYTEKYTKAFPDLMDGVKTIYSSLDKFVNDCYSRRTFSNFLSYFGLIEMEHQGEFPDRMTYVKKTDLFDRLINCKPHKVFTTML